ncbi:MAG: DUF5320 domain-containing protein [Candidatus Nanoarchaeia archaeon]|jgi:CRISPR/Cas system CMR-associated protein Cmr1 (group 7 of RAMP superfamily)
MPGFDGTGPKGLGARTGRGMGRCYCKPCRCPQLSKDEEKKLLESELAEINKRIKELE